MTRRSEVPGLTLARREENESEVAYYMLGARPLRDGLVSCSVYSEWVGWSPRNPKWEIRQAREIDYGYFVRATERFRSRRRHLVLNRHHLHGLLIRGGYAVVAAQVLTSWLPHILRPTECVKDVAASVPTYDPDDKLLHRRAPTYRQRRRVFERDNHRCVKCGRRPCDYLDLELHIHHVVPWRKHGPTVEENLVTLCGSCHKGLANADHKPLLRELAFLPGPVYSQEALPMPYAIVANLVDGFVVPAPP